MLATSLGCWHHASSSGLPWLWWGGNWLFLMTIFLYCPFFIWTLLFRTAKVLIMGAIFSTCMSFVMYHFIVLPRKQMHKRKGRNIVDSGITPYLIGFGVIMPICAVLPYYYMKYFCIRSKIIKFLAACAQLTLFFRCSEGESHVCHSDEILWVPFAFLT